MKKCPLMILLLLIISLRYESTAQVIINELMINPNNGQLPNTEYIELYNPTEHAILLEQYQLYINQNSITLPTQILAPKQYLTLVPPNREQDFAQFGNAVALTRWYALANTNADIRIMQDNILIDQVQYTDSWYKESNKKNGGWSLERINPLWTCSHPDNWIASQAPLGGTPGKPNSTLNNQHHPIINVDIVVLSAQDIQLTYPATYHLIDHLKASDFTIHPNSIIPIQLHMQDNKIILKLPTDLKFNQLYTLTTASATWCNMTLSITAQQFVYSTPAKYNDVVINEILFQPKDGGKDFVELYNRNYSPINLQGWRIGNRVISTDILLLQPREYLALTTDIENLRIHYPSARQGQLYQVSSLPAYPNTQGNVTLYDGQGTLIDSLYYHSNMHAKMIKNTKGISLERQHADKPTNEMNNFISASTFGDGATPGYKNSMQQEEFSKKIIFF